MKTIWDSLGLPTLASNPGTPVQKANVLDTGTRKQEWPSMEHVSKNDNHNNLIQFNLMYHLTN